MTEMAVNAPKANAAHPMVLCMVDVFSFMIRMLFLSVPLLLRHRSFSLFVPSSLITAQTSMPNAVSVYSFILCNRPMRRRMNGVSVSSVILYTGDFGT
jgi:hypothetical protein